MEPCPHPPLRYFPTDLSPRMLKPNTAWAPQWMDTSQGFQQRQNWLTHGWWEPESVRWFIFSLRTTANKSQKRESSGETAGFTTRVNNKSQTRSSKPHTQMNMCIDPRWPPDRLRQTSVSLQLNPQFLAVTHLSQCHFLSVRSTWSAESFIGFLKLIRICVRFLSFRIKTLRNEWHISPIFSVKLNACSACAKQQRGWLENHQATLRQTLEFHLLCVKEALQQMLSTTRGKEAAFFWIYFVQ